MADIKLSIVNQALTTTGNDELSSLNGNDFFVVVAVTNYDAIVAEELEESGAYFATKTANLTRLTAQAAAPFSTQWQLPADLLTLRALLRCGKELEGADFAIEGGVVRTGCWLGSTDGVLAARYIWNVPEAKWPARFRRIIVQRLEAVFLRATERHNEAEARDQSTEVRTIKARYAEASQRRNRPINGGTIVDARRGYVGRRG